MNLRVFDRLSRDLKRRLYLMIGRAVLRTIDDSGGLQIVQVEALRGEVIDRAERFQIYGLTSHPKPGADALVLAVGGMRQHPIVLVDDRRNRPKNLAEGEVMLYGPNNNSILLKADGSVEIQGTSVTHNGTNIGRTHRHGGVQSGGSTTGTPQ